MAYKISKTMYICIYQKVNPQFYVPAFCVFHDFMHIFYGPDHMPIMPIRTMFPDFMQFLGNPHKNANWGLIVYTGTQHMAYFKILFISSLSIFTSTG
jgi:hypothetical protein